MPADVVDLAHASFVDHQVDGFAVVLHIQPVADIFSCAVDRQGPVVQGVGDHQRDQLLRKMIRPVIIGAAADGHRQPIGPVVGQYQKIRSRLAGGVGTGGVDGCFFCKEQIRPVQRKVAVYLVGGYLVVAYDAVFAAGIHEHGSADDVRVQKYLGIFDGTVHMAFRREIYDHIRMLLLKEPVDSLPVCDALLHKTEISVIHDRCQSGEIACIGQAVQADDPVVRILVQHMENKVASDKACTAGDDDRCLFHMIFLSKCSVYGF